MVDVAVKRASEIAESKVGMGVKMIGSRSG
jgi:hypothetical protein